MQIQTINKDEKNWGILFEQIVKGNVIPVIGPELVRVGQKSSLQFLIDAFAGLCGIGEGEMTTFSQLVYDKRFKDCDLGDIHDLLALNLKMDLPYRFVTLELPTEKRSRIEVEIINKTSMNRSFVIISN